MAEHSAAHPGTTRGPYTVSPRRDFKCSKSQAIGATSAAAAAKVAATNSSGSKEQQGNGHDHKEVSADINICISFFLTAQHASGTLLASVWMPHAQL